MAFDSLDELWEDGETIFQTNLEWDASIRFFNDHGIISSQADEWILHEKASIERFEKLKSLLRKCGYTPRVIRDSTIEKFLCSLVGHSIYELPRAIEETLVPKYIKSLNYRTEVLYAQFGGYVIGLSRFFYTYGSGFSVRLVLSSQFSYVERKDFVIKNRKRLIVYVQDEIWKSKKIMKAIGSLDYFKCTEITVLRNPEAEFKFDVKREIL